MKKISAGTALFVTGVTDNLYKIYLPDEEHGFIRSNMVINTETPVRTIKADTALILRSSASNFAQAKKKIKAGSTINIYGSYRDFYFIKSGSLTGWIKAK